MKCRKLFSRIRNQLCVLSQTCSRTGAVALCILIAILSASCEYGGGEEVGTTIDDVVYFRFDKSGPNEGPGYCSRFYFKNSLSWVQYFDLISGPTKTISHFYIGPNTNNGAPELGSRVKTGSGSATILGIEFDFFRYSSSKKLFENKGGSYEDLKPEQPLPPGDTLYIEIKNQSEKYISYTEEGEVIKVREMQYFDASSRGVNAKANDAEQTLYTPKPNLTTYYREAVSNQLDQNNFFECGTSYYFEIFDEKESSEKLAAAWKT